MVDPRDAVSENPEPLDPSAEREDLSTPEVDTAPGQGGTVGEQQGDDPDTAEYDDEAEYEDEVAYGGLDTALGDDEDDPELDEATELSDRDDPDGEVEGTGSTTAAAAALDDETEDGTPRRSLRGRFGEGIAARENESGITRRAVTLAVIALVVAAAAIIGVIVWLAPGASTPDSRSSVVTKADGAARDLRTLHDRQVGEIVLPGTRTGAPVTAVVCGIEETGNAERNQRCEERITTFVPSAQIERSEDLPTVPCQGKEIALTDIRPLVTNVPAGGCPASPALAWWQNDGDSAVGPWAAWLKEGTLPQTGTQLVAISTRHPLGTFPIGTCPDSGCTGDQVQLPKLDLKIEDVA